MFTITRAYEGRTYTYTAHGRRRAYDLFRTIRAYYPGTVTIDPRLSR